MTRGALYHHFASKTEVAAAVVEELEGELVDRVVAAALRGSGVRDQLHRGCRAYMDACADPTMARCPHLAEVFARAHEEGITVPGDPEVAAALLLGFLNEAAGLVAAAPTDQALRRRVVATVDQFLTRLFG